MSQAAIELVPRASEEAYLVNVVETDAEAGEHYRTSGFALLGMGGLAFGLYAATVSGVAAEGFIDANGVLGIACLFIGVGTYMVDVMSNEAR